MCDMLSRRIEEATLTTPKGPGLQKIEVKRKLTPASREKEAQPQRHDQESADAELRNGSGEVAEKTQPSDGHGGSAMNHSCN